MRSYHWEAAVRRVDNLRRAGVWPGIRDHGDGSYSLSFDPAEIGTQPDQLPRQDEPERRGAGG